MVYLAPKTVLMYRIAFLISLSLFFFSCRDNKTAVLPYYNTPDFTPQFINDSDKLRKEIPHTIADFAFRDQNNKLVTQKDIEGKIHIACFFFTSCGSICPQIMNNLKRVD